MRYSRMGRTARRDRARRSVDQNRGRTMTMLKGRFWVAALLLIGAGTPAANAQSCPQHVAGGTFPALLNPQLAQGAQVLCYRQFVLLHSARTRTPLWSAEHLTAARIDAA